MRALFCAGLTLTMLFAAGSPSLHAQAAQQAMQQGTAAMQHGDFAAAITAFRQVTSALPQLAEAHFDLGLALEQHGDLAESITELRRALALKPALRGADLFLGIAEYRANHLAAAEAALQRAVKLTPSDAKAWMWLGITQTALGETVTAVTALDTAARLSPADPEILYHQGRAHLLVSKAAYQRMFAVDPDGFRVHEVLAQAAAEGGRTQEAITELQAAIQRAPRQPGLHEQLGDLDWSAADTDHAAEQYRAELALDPDSFPSNYKLGSLLVTVGQAQQALPVLQRAVQLDASYPNTFYYLGRAQLDLQMDSAGLASLQRAAVAKDDPALQTLAEYQLARAYRRLHRDADAATALAKFQALRSQKAEAEQAATSARVARYDDRLKLPQQESVPPDPATPQP